ncbi:MAG: ATP-binding cassette domain-containing protein [Lachnospiraceae bacterium]|nr:ATP-binding cassette domain-containing protein [Lachnospiraceae bacterium]
MTPGGEKLIRFENVTKEFSSKNNKTLAVNNVNLEIEKGDIFGIIGFSGAGKSTLVRLINLLEYPSKGDIYFDDVNLTKLKPGKLRKYRQKIGMIFQQFNLLSQRNVLGNIIFPLEIAGVKKADAKKRAIELLELVGLLDKAKSYPAQLSGGQKQRVAIARALATNPDVLLCDEATSALDPITTKSILELLKEINEKLGVTIVVITHEMKVVEQICDKVAVMSNGVIEETGNVKDVFLNPKSETAKKLILPESSSLKDNSKRPVLRIAFEGQSAFEPIISSLTIECNTMVNILGANTENISGKAFGQMLIELPDDNNKTEQIKKYLTDKGIYFEEGGQRNE